MVFFELFITFFLIGLFTFGGGYAMIPMIQEQVVGKGWLEADTLTNFIAISEVTPGPFAINIATFIGSEVGGVLGSAVATLGVILPSFIIILLVAWILTKFLNNKYVKGALKGVQPVVIGLILSTAITFFLKGIFGGSSIADINTFDIKSFSMLLMLFGLTKIYKTTQKKNLNPIFMLIIAAGLGILIFN